MARQSPEEILEQQVGRWAGARIARKLDEAGWAFITKAERQSLYRALDRLQKLGGSVPAQVGRKAVSKATGARRRNSSAAA